MEQKDWERLKELFTAAAELPPDERGSFVTAECVGNSVLEAELRSLLDAHGEGEKLIEDRGFQLPRPTEGDLVDYRGRQFGKYRIVREIGYGGMGTVFLAERSDGEFEQKVALKIIRQTVADSGAEQRFRRERKILAGLNHPNIAQLHDGGISELGELYFAMEYIEGRPITLFADQKGLSIEERLRLFLKVCSAVSFAHRNLTVHRDIKPTNILVTQDREPKLLDFGLAKMIDQGVADEETTATVMRAFTPAYASPEQILGRPVSTASDIYSLGVVLYELLAGKKPFHFEGKSLDEIIRTITGSDPEKPSYVRGRRSDRTVRYGPALSPDIDNICLKCLQKEPDRRYTSVEELSADLDRYLEGRPVLARPNTFAYLASKFIRRNKAAVAAGVLVIISLFAGLGISLWQAEEARRERDRAEKRFDDVRKLSNALLFEISPKIETLEGSTEARELLVKRALEYLDSLSNEAAGDPTLEAELAAAYEKIGELQGHPSKPNLGDLAGALASYEKANALRQKQPSTYENKRLLAENFRHLANARFTQGDTPGLLAALVEARRLFEELLAEAPHETSVRLSYLKTLAEISQYHQANNEYGEAIRFAELALKGTEDLAPDARETREVFFVTHADLGNALSWNGEQERAEKEMAKAVTGVEALLAEQPNDARTRHIAWRVLMLASGIYEEINDAISLEFSRRAVSTAERGVEIDPADIQSRHNLARATYRKGVVLVNLKRTSAAVAALEAAEQQFAVLIRREPRNRFYQTDLGRIYNRMGLAKRLQNDLQGSNRAFDRSIEIWQQIAEMDPGNKNARRDIALAKKNLAENYSVLGDVLRARASFSEAIQLFNSLKTENALPEVDNKLLAEMEEKVARL